MTARRHYLELDGLRGVAALSVALFHLQPFFGGRAFFGHGYLAVDFFFMLSGFVLAHAYGEKLARGGQLVPFMRDRIIRLYSMLIVGAVLGATSLLIAPGVKGHGLGAGTLAFAANALGLPAIWLPNPFWINEPTWSLFFELVASAGFALAAPYLRGRTLIAAVAGFAALMLAFHLAKGTFGMGWTRKGMPGGFARVGAGFTIGLLLYRVHLAGTLVTEARRWWVSVLLIAALVALPTRGYGNLVYDPVVVFGLFPLIILLAAGSAPWFPRVARWSGDLSYPFYVIHIPALAIWKGAALALGIELSAASMIVALGLTLALAAALLRFYDEPLRARLRRRQPPTSTPTAIAPLAPNTIG